MKKHHLLCIASHATAGLKRLAYSCAQHDIQLSILGIGEPYLGNGSKPLRVFDYLCKHCDDDDLVICVDAYDVVVLADIDEIVRTFETFDAAIVFSAERQCWPYPLLASRFPESTETFRYLNSGLYMGSAGALKAVIKQILFTSHLRSDQLLYQLHLLEHPHDIALDHSCRLFQSLFDFPEGQYRLEDGRFVNTGTNTKPAFLHGNGRGGLALLASLESDLFGSSFLPHDTPIEASELPAAAKQIREDFRDSYRKLFPQGMASPVLQKLYILWHRRPHWPYLTGLRIRKWRQQYNRVIVQHTIANLLFRIVAFPMKLFPSLKAPLLRILKTIQGLPLFRLVVPGMVRRLEAQRSQVLHQYRRADGSFDYDTYKKIQTEGNKQKITSCFVQEENIEFIADYIKQQLSNVRFGICHGTRRGKEQEWFRKYLDAEVIGTEISDTATTFPHTIEWDFHQVKDEWINATDFIYSNSIDHSYDPEYCLNNWMKCIKPGGLCILEHTDLHGPEGSSELDPFGVRLSTFLELIQEWGAGKYAVREVLEAPAKYVDLDVSLIVIEKHSAVG